MNPALKKFAMKNNFVCIYVAMYTNDFCYEKLSRNGAYEVCNS